MWPLKRRTPARSRSASSQQRTRHEPSAGSWTVPDVPMDSPGYHPSKGVVRGRHYTRHLDELAELKRTGRLDEAAGLVKELIDAVERQDDSDLGGSLGSYYHQAAIIQRKRGDLEAEAAVIERFLGRKRVVGDKNEFRERLIKVRAKQ